jgi:hypothetical protein
MRRNGKRVLVLSVLVLAIVAVMMPAAVGRDRPFGTSSVFLLKWGGNAAEFDSSGSSGNSGAGGTFSTSQIEKFRCESAGNPAAAVDMSCNTTEYGQNFAPDNEIAIAVDPNDPDHLLAGSNDYYYRFNNSTGARQALVPTGFFTSFDGGATWVDGQIPQQSGNGAGDPSPAFDGKHDVALMAQLENVGGQGGPWASMGNVSVSRSTDGGITWSQSIKVFKGQGAGIGPANNAVFWDKEWLTVNNYPGTPGYGRAVITATRFLNGPHGSYAESPIYMSYSDDGGATWSEPTLISGKNPEFCTYQETGPDDGSCDESQFGIPEFGPDGTLYVHFINGQNEEEWEQDFEFDSQLMVVKASPTSGVPSFGAPVHVVDLEDGGTDMPYSVIGRQTVWGHQIRWDPVGNISVNPTDPDDVVIVYADRGTPNPNATEPAYEGCLFESRTQENDYDPCDAHEDFDTDVFIARSTDGGETWDERTLLDDAGGAPQWFPWADHGPDGSLAVAWDEDTAAAPADTFEHVLWTEGGGKEALGPEENIDISVTHWAGQYVPQSAWPTICGPAGYSDPPVEDAEGKDCNVFHGDYTGLAVGPDGAIHVVWRSRTTCAPRPAAPPPARSSRRASWA